MPRAVCFVLVVLHHDVPATDPEISEAMDSSEGVVDELDE
jgi:hypothetical protein